MVWKVVCLTLVCVWVVWLTLVLMTAVWCGSGEVDGGVV